MSEKANDEMKEIESSLMSELETISRQQDKVASQQLWTEVATGPQQEGGGSGIEIEGYIKGHPVRAGKVKAQGETPPGVRHRISHDRARVHIWAEKGAGNNGDFEEG